jgi:hypothetical protein
MFSDGKRDELSENLLQNEALFDTSINGRDTLYDELRTPEISDESELTGILRNYRRNPPIELTEDQIFEQYQSIRPFEFTKR